VDVTCPTRESEVGSSLLGLLVALVILAGLAVSIPLMTAGGSSSPKTNAPAAGADINAASVAACQADYAAAQTAVNEYQVQKGSLPTDTNQLQPYLRDSLTNASFSITIDPHHPGRLQVTTPGHSPTDGLTGCAA
jgi:hypothetical protein